MDDWENEDDDFGSESDKVTFELLLLKWFVAGI